MGWLTNLFQKPETRKTNDDDTSSKPKLPKTHANQWIAKGQPAQPQDCTLYILDAGGRSREMQCLIGEHVSREIYERNKDSAGHLYGFVYYQEGKPLMQVANKDTWLAAQRQFEHDGPEVQEISFHCAKDGTEFFVSFARQSSAEKFRIRSIEMPRTNAGAGDEQTFPYWARTKLSPGVRSGSPRSRSFDAKEFDFSGWQCACCKHKTWPEYVKCSKCNRLVCGSKVISIKNGPKTFQCAPDCGSSGVLGGEISSYNAERKEPEASKQETGESRPSRNSEITPSDRNSNEQLRSGREGAKLLSKR